MTSEVPASHEILLRLPARAPFGRLARIGAASLALRQSMSFREIDDLRLAVDEAVVLLFSAPPGGDTAADIVVDYHLGEGSIEIEMQRTDAAALPENAVDRFDGLVGPLVDDLDVDAGRGWVRLVLRHHPDETLI
ncbi:MAG: hypothetical protein D6683_12645 [Actinomyces sp.]|nr:MAG: hypothetical protein D6683_12645 [Actinomyces sp.]